jgi:hypothetical protein
MCRFVSGVAKRTGVLIQALSTTAGPRTRSCSRSRRCRHHPSYHGQMGDPRAVAAEQGADRLSTRGGIMGTEGLPRKEAGDEHEAN